MYEPRQRIDIRALLDRARGHWERVFLAFRLPKPFSDAMNSKSQSRHWPCPVCNAPDKFRMFNDWRETGGCVCSGCGFKRTGLQSLLWLEGTQGGRAYLEVLKRLRDAVDGAPIETIPSVSTPIARDDDLKRALEEDRKALAKMRSTWAESFPVHHPNGAPVRRYIAARGLALMAEYPTALRVHPGLEYWEQTDSGQWKLWGKFPAMLGVVTDPAGRAINLHRTYLNPDGSTKADVPEAKKSMSAMNAHKMTGAAVRLGKPDRVLHLAEGIETALAVMEITGQACWSTISANIMEKFLVPLGIELVCIWADKDRSGTGQSAAEELVKRLRDDGIRAIVVLPPYPIPDGTKGLDWLDVLVQFGRETVRSLDFVRHLQLRINSLLTAPVQANPSSRSQGG